MSFENISVVSRMVAKRRGAVIDGSMANRMSVTVDLINGNNVVVVPVGWVGVLQKWGEMK